MKAMNKKGVIDQLGPIVTGLVSIGILLVVGFLIMGNVATNTQVAADANASAAIAQTTQAAEDIPGWLPIIIITIIGALLIGLVSIFRGRR